jgi:hypothetical protein
MKPLQKELPSSDKFLYVLYDFENTQDTKHSEKAAVHVPNVVCLRHFCFKCENLVDLERDCLQCGKRILGRSGRKFANLSVRAAAVGQQRHRYRV